MELQDNSLNRIDQKKLESFDRVKDQAQNRMDRSLNAEKFHQVVDQKQKDLTNSSTFKIGEEMVDVVHKTLKKVNDFLMYNKEMNAESKVSKPQTLGNYIDKVA